MFPTVIASLAILATITVVYGENHTADAKDAEDNAVADNEDPGASAIAAVIRKSITSASDAVSSVQAAAVAAASGIETVAEAVGLVLPRCKGKIIIGGISYNYLETDTCSCISSCVYILEGRKVFFSTEDSVEDLDPKVFPTTPTPTIYDEDATGLLIAGGFNENDKDYGKYYLNMAATSVELWSPRPFPNCTFPSLPDGGMIGHTLDSVKGMLVACYFKSCIQLTKNGTTPLMDTLQSREQHSSTVLGNRILLIGGQYDPSLNTTELVSVDGGKSESLDSFILEPGRMQHCAIKISKNKVILTGGENTGFLVTEHSLDNVVTTKTLPSLTTGRYDHACGQCWKAGRMMLIVTGGRAGFSMELTDTTEVYDYSLGTGGSWREVEGRLPSSREGLRGAMVAGEFHVSGGWDGSQYLDQILAWNANNETWAVAGTMGKARAYHAVTEVTLASVTEFCPTPP